MIIKEPKKIKWSNRLEERAGMSWDAPLVWWVYQKEADAKIRKIERRMRAAERLLESKMCRRECACCKEAKAHLEAVQNDRLDT